MYLNRILVISFIVVLMSSYETSSSLLFTILMKLMMIKGALFMSMPMAIGAFVMGQGTGFFAGNMMGGYMMLRAANRYHNKEKTRWVSHSNWHGPPYHTDPYQKGYDSGKAIIDAINLGKAKVNAISSIFKPFIPAAAPPKKPVYGPPPPKYGPPKYYPPSPISYGPPDYGYGSYSNPSPAHQPAPLGYDSPPASSAPPSSNPYISSGPLTYHDYYPGSNRKSGFSDSLKSSIGGGSTFLEQMERNFENIRRVHENSATTPVSPSGFYTSAFATPGQEYTGILTNDSEDDKYLRDGDDDPYSMGASKTSATVATAPNEILESYLEQRLKAEAENQKDLERKHEAQQLVQMLRKAYLKQLVDSLKEEEATEKQKANRRLESSSFASLTSSIESLFGSRETRSMEQKQKSGNIENDAARSESMQNLIKDLLVNEVFTSNKGVETPSNKEDRIDTAEVESITERVLALTSSEREELVKGLGEVDDDHVQEQVLAKPTLLNGEIKIDEGNRATISTSTTEATTPIIVLPSSSENIIIASSATEATIDKTEDNNRAEREMMQMVVPAQWILTDTRTFSSDVTPVGLRVRRQTHNRRQGVPPEAASGAAPAQKAPSAEEQRQIQGFVDDIRKFFTLLSALDQDQCLQKLVCDVHTNEKDISTLTQYEKNILTTFKLMKTLMPEGQEDSSTKYRYAAVVGETGQSIELCQQTYSSCTYSSNQIVELGSQPVEGDQQAGLPLELSDLQPQTQALPTSSAPVTPTTTTTTARPSLSKEPEQDTQEDTQRRNYVESNQYHMANQRRRYQQQQQYQQSPPHRPRPAQFHRERLSAGVPPLRRRQRPPQHQYPSREESDEYRGPPEPHRYRPNGGNDGFFNYGEFSDFFRSAWSDRIVPGQMRRNRQYRFPAEVMEEIGI